MKKIAVMGGSFNPIHKGHLSLAVDAKTQLNLDKVIMVLSKIQPFKLDNVLDSYMRMDMLKLAVEELDNIEASDLELKREGISYTYETMRQIKSNVDEEVNIYFLSGTDAFLGIKNWKNAENLFEENNFIVGSRPGYKEEELDSFIREIENKYETEIIKIKNEKVNISSTQIRNCMLSKQNVSDLIPKSVEEYILENDVYIKGKPKKRFLSKDGSNIEKIEQFIKENLSENRYIHTKNVMKMAVKLAETYNVDKESVEIATLAHDIAKEFPIYQLNDLVEYYSLDDKYKNMPNLSHSKVGASIIKDELTIENQQIIDSISYHTTGRKGMSLMEKIVYLADSIEMGRNYDGVEALRELAFSDIDRACYICLKRSIEHLKEKRIYVDKDSMDALLWFEEMEVKK